VSAPLRPVEWKAEEYDAQSAPHEEWAAQITARLKLNGDETILDAGCGTGRLTKELVELVPNGRVIGVDASTQMLEKARDWLGDDVELHNQDLTSLDLGDQVDVVYSSAVFHWIEDHEALFRSLHSVMKPGAVLEAQCGGDDNIAEVHRAVEAIGGDERFAPYLRGDRRPWNYASVGDTELRMRQAGFTSVRAWIEPWPVHPRDPAAYLRAVILPWHLDRLPPELHDLFVKTVIESAPRPMVVNYMRLNISAVA
jgi:trans-aconitate 2-methyltransferase